eukprot:2738285-Heterocapsa_arctica.AAC.1
MNSVGWSHRHRGPRGGAPSVSAPGAAACRGIFAARFCARPSLSGTTSFSLPTKFTIRMSGSVSVRALAGPPNP